MMKRNEMGSKEGNESPAMGVNSSVSIALLQERFKQLQRLKEMRQERDPLRLINKVAYKVSGHFQHDVSSRYAVPRQRRLFGVAQSSTPSLSLSLRRNERDDEFCRWHSGNTVMTSPSPFIDLVSCDDDVDTSLHL